jgi:hypothetical protein
MNDNKILKWDNSIFLIDLLQADVVQHWIDVASDGKTSL